MKDENYLQQLLCNIKVLNGLIHRESRRHKNVHFESYRYVKLISNQGQLYHYGQILSYYLLKHFSRAAKHPTLLRCCSTVNFLQRSEDFFQDSTSIPIHITAAAIVQLNEMLTLVGRTADPITLRTPYFSKKSLKHCVIR